MHDDAAADEDALSGGDGADEKFNDVEVNKERAGRVGFEFGSSDSMI